MVGRSNIAVCVLALFLLFSAGQEALAQLPLRLGRYTITLEANAKRLLRCRNRLGKQLGEPLEGHYYVVMQFGSIPDAAVQEGLRRDSVRLYDYLGSNAYYARMPEGVRLRGLRKSGVVAISRVKGAWKTADALVDDAVPPHAKQGWGIKAVVHVWDGFGEAWVRRRLQGLGLVYSDFHFAGMFGSLRLVANRRDLLRLADEDWVKRVGLQGPPSVLFEQGVGGGKVDLDARLL